MNAHFRIRQLHESDRQTMQNYWLSLSNEDRRGRFHCCVGDEMLKRQIKRIDFSCDRVIGVFSDGQLCGTAELMSLTDVETHGRCEIGIVLCESARGTGIAGTMIDILRKQASAMGYGVVELHMADDNRPMRRLAVRSGFHILRNEDGLTGHSSISSSRPAPAFH